MKTITRVGWCKQCAKLHNPHCGDLFMTFGSGHLTFVLQVGTKNGAFGYVPHIYRLEQEIGDRVVILKSCAMYECGVMRSMYKGEWLYHVKEYEREYWDIKQWEALLNYKRDKQYMI